MKKILLLFLFFVSSLSMQGVFGHTTLCSCYSATCYISQNTLYETSISSAGQVDTFKFTPQFSGYYVIETYGTLDTYMSRYLSPYLTLTNDDGGEKRNATMGFYATGGRQYIFNVRAYSSNTTGDYYIQVRKQMASIMTFDYGPGDIDTTPDAVTPINELNNMGYTTVDFQNQSESTLKSDDYTGLSNFNKEVVMYSGHGNAGFVSVANYLYSKTYLHSDELPYMGNTKLVVWATCHSAEGTSTLESMANQSILNGAASSIGWPDVTWVPSSKIFTNHLFAKLNDGYTVAAASSYAAGKLYWWFDPVKDYIIFGDGQTYLYSEVNNKQNTISYIPLYTDEPYDFMQMTTDSESDDYCIDTVIKTEEGLFYSSSLNYSVDGEEVVRNYKMINGIITNEYYDILVDSNLIINKSNISISVFEEISMGYHSFDEFTFKNIKELERLYLGFSIKNIESHNVYVKLDYGLRPIKIFSIDFYNPTTNEWFSLVKSYDIISGEEIDYYSFSVED